ncbi:5-formyltetrahydrofolate cyclo-ligase [Aspergillus coremiiformis]|uniref:5-formyltetrahydrofolate cyclo-ligase n=1 Tax=Aspergillus coremiiformis TaxID=138285 RepID=A0A5N6ZA74_9EURO|nr:5-formyltetrahydrofolate cyclo-ligase [Aspergillus coremiiformis]
MMAGLQAAKKDLRRQMRDVLQKIPADSIFNQSRVAMARLFSLTEYQNAKRIGVYLSMASGELSTTAIVQDALMSGKEVFIPYIHNVELSSTRQKTSIMDMLALESMEEFNSLTPDKWGIPSLAKPQVGNKANCLGGTGVSPSMSDKPTEGEYGLDLIVMPGMAFDPECRRLGHGKGYYDHFLTRYSKAVEGKTTAPKMPLTVALSLKEQTLPLTEQIPVANHDWLVDILIVGDNRCFVRRH